MTRWSCSPKPAWGFVLLFPQFDVVPYTARGVDVLQKTTQEDLEFLRNQSITVEVNMARLYNYDVLRRRKAEEAKKRKEEAKAAA